jgi:hypothetical protein
VSIPNFDQKLEFRNDEAATENGLMSQEWLAKTNTRIPPLHAHESQQWAPRRSSQRPESAGNAGSSWRVGAQNMRPQAVNNSSQTMKERPGGETTLPFVTAPEVQSNLVPTGRKPAGTRMPTPPPAPAPVIASNFEPVQSRGKTRLNLLNPMSLLARRRTSHNIPYLLPSLNTPNIAESNPLDGYDPRIRGTKVHDFSAPRPQRRNGSYNNTHNLEGSASSNAQHQRSPGSVQPDVNRIGEERTDVNRWSGGNHTPVFTEDFDEEQYPATGRHVRKASDLTDLPLPKPPYAKEGKQHSGQPPSVRRSVQSSQATTKANYRSPPSSPGPPVPPKSEIDFTSKPLEASVERKTASSISAPEDHPSASSSNTRPPRNVSEDIGLTNVPRHMKSTSSRFSFDMIGAASQEKLLEDRHRQKALEKKSISPEPNDQDDMYAEDYYDYDDMDDGDELEERIPGINADAEDGFGEIASQIHSQIQGMSGFTFHSIDTPVAISPMTPGIVSTPRDANGEVIGFALTTESPNIPMESAQLTVQQEIPTNIDIKISESTPSVGNGGLGLQDIDLGETFDSGVEKTTDTEREPKSFWAQQPAADNEDDDLYFDDGIIDHPDKDEDEDEDAADFDESVFDNDDTDQYGRPIRSLSSLPTLYSPPFVKSDPSLTDQGMDYSQQVSRMSRDLEDLEEPHSATSVQSQYSLMPHHSGTEDIKGVGQCNPLQPTPSLTQDTLSAYQSALAAAAYRAAANGRFRRDSSPTVHFDGRDENPNLGEIVDDGQLSLELPLRQPLSPDYEDGFDYDDALEDDLIIAEANAEALANDSEGFYGQEFGFYSAPQSGESQYGGCFGPRGVEGIVRSQSGRIAGREPNLTPITERSEYSNRNSMMSLPLSGIGHSGPLNSPGLSQLAGIMSEFGEEDMSLSALLKLRRGAWGGSQASLRSSNGNGTPMSPAGEDSSPVTQQAPWSQGAGTNGAGQARKNSTFSLSSDVPSCAPGSPADTNSAPSSPTITMGNFSKASPPSTSVAPSMALATAPSLPGPPAPPAALISSLQMRPISASFSPTTKLASVVGLMPFTEGGESASVIRRAQGHRHTASADSISYMQEEDPVSGARWVLERRRTAESGEVEILGREVVSGGRI